MALADRRAAAAEAGWVFFDRGLIDALSALEDMTGDRVLHRIGRQHPSHTTVFLTPPWPEIYRTDGERQHSFAVAEAEYVRLIRDYAALGYATLEVPKIAVGERADFVLAALSLGQAA